ncbi:MAG TPA: hypothetical protein PKJ02_06915 [Candidatus Avimonas sp.]|jgi:hypothetical protein|nr:hypothetical protein [Candidatus Avimonas sp.]
MRFFCAMLYELRQKAAGKHLRRMMFAAAVTALCFCFASITAWAMICDMITAGPSVLRAGEYGIRIEISDDDGNVIKSSGGIIAGQGFDAKLPAGSYNVSLTADGTVSGGVAGYGKVSLGDVHHYTKPMFKGDRIDFRVLLDGETTISFYFEWGKREGGDIRSGTVLSVGAGKSAEQGYLERRGTTTTAPATTTVNPATTTTATTTETTTTTSVSPTFSDTTGTDAADETTTGAGTDKTDTASGEALPTEPVPDNQE